VINHKKFEGHTPGPLEMELREEVKYSNLIRALITQHETGPAQDEYGNVDDGVVSIISDGDAAYWYAKAADDRIDYLLAENLKLRAVVEAQNDMIEFLVNNFTDSMNNKQAYEHDAHFAAITAAKEALG